MKVVKYITLLLMTLKLCGSIILDGNLNKVQVELNVFMDKLKHCPQVQSHTCYHTGSNSYVASDIRNSFIIKNNNCGIVIQNKNITDDFTHEVNNVFIFVDSVEKVYIAAKELIASPYWRPKTYSYFVLTKQVEDKSFLPEILSYIWSKNILNFLLVFVHHDYEVYTFLPFAKNKIFDIKSRGYFCNSVKLDKIKNFNRNPLRASFYKYPPKIFEENGRWTGIDFNIFLLMAEMLNATVVTLPVSTANETMTNLYSNKADIFLIRLFQVQFYHNASFSCAYEMDDRVAIVPRPLKIPSYQHIMYIFDAKTWLVLLLTIILLQAIFFLNSYTHGTSLDFFIMVWSPLLNLAIPNSLIDRTKPKWLLLTWVYSCLVLGASIQTSLTRSFVQPIYEKSIRTIDDLIRNNRMKIYIHSFLTQPSLIPENLGLKTRYSHMDASETIQHIEERNVSGVFVVSRQLAKYYVNQNKKKYGDPTYEIVEEALVPGSMVFLLQKTSPFLDKINYCLLLIQQHALLRENRYESVAGQESNILELYHFLVVFYILLLGYLVGFLILFLEKYIYKKFNN